MSRSKRVAYTTNAHAKRELKLSYLGNISSSAKIVKNQIVSQNYTYIIYMSPASQSGYNVCKFSTPECRLGCLATSGRAAMNILSGSTMVIDARNKKSRLFNEHKEFFIMWMIDEMKRYQRKADRDGYYFSARLNGTSVIDYSEVKLLNENIFQIFPEVQFYDYTKDYEKMMNNVAPNYDLTFSYTGKVLNIKQSKSLLDSGKNVAVVFDVKGHQPLPKTFMGYKVIDGDLTDYRPGDEKGVIVGLHWKNIANKKAQEQIKNSVFVVKSDNDQCTW
jgi:hypothetical protein